VTLEEIRIFEIPERVVRSTESALREHGAKGFELFVLWSGRIADDLFLVEHIYVPNQRTFRLPSGACVRVEAAELDRLNRWLYAYQQVLGIQVHTHPAAAYHSETDNTYPMVTLLGGISVVVPDFCREEFGSPGTAVFRLRRGGWELQGDAAANELLQVVG
jgi:hypothetical protein